MRRQSKCLVAVVVLAVVLLIGFSGSNSPCYFSWKTGHMSCPAEGEVERERSLFDAGFFHHDMGLCLRGKKVLFLGDSQARLTAFKLQEAFFTCKEVKRGNRCNEGSKFMHLPVATLNPDRESKILSDLVAHGNGTGPTSHGLANPQCRDCSGCEATLWACQDGFELETIAVEFARDFSTLTDLYNTTQENVVAYLKRSPRTPDYIVFNTGLHDLSSPVETYARALDWYTDLLRSVPGAKLIWVTTSTVNEARVPLQYQQHTKADFVRVFNEAAGRVMAGKGIPVVDAYRISALGLELDWYEGPVHLIQPNSAYYDIMSLLILNEICTAASVADPSVR